MRENIRKALKAIVESDLGVNASTGYTAPSEFASILKGEFPEEEWEKVAENTTNSAGAGEENDGGAGGGGAKKKKKKAEKKPEEDLDALLAEFGVEEGGKKKGGKKK